MVQLDIIKPTGTFQDLRGMRFHRLIVLRWAGRSRVLGRHLWLCLCDCGKKSIVQACHLKSGHTTSCGCFFIERKTKHGMVGYPEYKTWISMVSRCKKGDKNYRKYYGNRGITVCKHWQNSFESFFADMGFQPTPKHTLERLDNSKGYEPENVIWATMKQQARNKRTSHFLTFSGKTLTVTDWSIELGMNNPSTLFGRLRLGWSIEKSITTPVRRQCAKRQISPKL